MEPLDDLDPLAYVFPEEAGGSRGAGGAAAPMRARQAPNVAFPLDPLLGPVFRAFERAGVRWCLLRLPRKTAGAQGMGRDALTAPSKEDVAALVDLGAIDDARAILMTHGFAPLPAWGSSPRFVGYDPDTDVWVTLEVVTRLAYGSPIELETGAEQGCLERRRWDGGIFVLSPDDEFWTLLLGVLFHWNEADLDADDAAASVDRQDARVLARLERLTIEARPDSPLARLVAELLPPRWSPVHVVDCVWEGDWETLDRLVPFMREAWTSLPGGAARRRRLANRLLHQICDRHLFPPRQGLSVALLAPDPAAKTALANALGRTFFLPVTFMRMGAAPRRRRNGRLARAGFCRTLITQAQRYAVGRLRKAKGRLVIFDRYTYDWRLPPAKRIPALGRLRRLVLGRSVPAPDLVVVLDSPPPGRRRHGLGEAEPGSRVLAAEALRERYLELSQRLPDAIVVDAGAGSDAVRREVTARIWRAYAAAPTPAWLRPIRALASRLSRG